MSRQGRQLQCSQLKHVRKLLSQKKKNHVYPDDES